MDEKLKNIINDYINDVNEVCLNLLEGLDLKTKSEFLHYRAKNKMNQFNVNGIQYTIHGVGCFACSDEKFVDWDFGYGSRWCGINPSSLAFMLEEKKDDNTKYYDAKKIKEECEQAIMDGEMYKKYGQYYFTIPTNELFEPTFPNEFDTLVIQHFDFTWSFPKNKLIDRFIRKSRKIYKQIGSHYDTYTLKFYRNDNEIYTIPFDDIGYPEKAVSIMFHEILTNLSNI